MAGSQGNSWADWRRQRDAGGAKKRPGLFPGQHALSYQTGPKMGELRPNSLAFF
jgi:hypothetical protein